MAIVWLRVRITLSHTRSQTGSYNTLRPLTQSRARHGVCAARRIMVEQQTGVCLNGAAYNRS